MKQAAPRLAIVLVVLLSPLAVAQTKQQRATCDSKHSQIAKAYCSVLADEFQGKKIRGGVYEINGILFNPMVESNLLAPAVFDKAYTNLLKSTLSAGEKSSAVSLLQAEINELAQLLSTKSSVPQTGAAAQAIGTTDLTSKPTTTDLISLASESGAFTDTVSGSTLTIQANVNGVRRYLASHPFAALTPTASDVLQHLTVAATFNVTQNGSATVPVTGQATSSTPASLGTILLPTNNVSFTSVTAKFAVYRPYTPTSSKFISAWKAAMAKNTTASAGAAQLFTDFHAAIPSQHDVIESPSVSAALATWQANAAADENNNDFSKFVDDFDVFTNAVIAHLETDSNFDKNVVAVAADLSRLQDIRNTVLDEARGSLITAAYTYNRPTGKPATHDATAIVGYVWSQRDEGAQLTFNFAGSWFDTVPAGATYGRTKDYQISGQFDQPIGKDRTSPRAVLSFAGYGQYQYTANILNVTATNIAPGTNISVPANSQVFTSTPGWLGVAQTKLALTIGKGLTLPVAVKWSNKTDLLSDSDWKGQFGLSYDLSALSSILAGK